MSVPTPTSTPTLLYYKRMAPEYLKTAATVNTDPTSNAVELKFGQGLFDDEKLLRKSLLTANALQQPGDDITVIITTYLLKALHQRSTILCLSASLMATEQSESSLEI